MKKHRHGFTLAEVLITLVIIGIIAAMTIPTLMNKTNEQETVVATKKAYSILSQAWQRMIAENGEIYPQTLGSDGAEASKNFAEFMLPFLSVQKNCGLSTDEDCFASENYAVLNQGKLGGSRTTDYNANSDFYKIVLSDGMAISFAAFYTYYRAHGATEPLNAEFGTIIVDVNGDKGPNTVGVDLHGFRVTKYGIFPAGMPEDPVSLYDCWNGGGNDCTAWVVTKGNMDYLKKTVTPDMSGWWN